MTLKSHLHSVQGENEMTSNEGNNLTFPYGKIRQSSFSLLLLKIHGFFFDVEFNLLRASKWTVEVWASLVLQCVGWVWPDTFGLGFFWGLVACFFLPFFFGCGFSTSGFGSSSC